MTMKSPIRRGPKDKYPWKLWFDGKKRKIEQGKHFDVSTRNMVAQLYVRANRDKVEVKVSRFDKFVTLQVIRETNGGTN